MAGPFSRKDMHELMSDCPRGVEWSLQKQRQGSSGMGSADQRPMYGPQPCGDTPGRTRSRLYFILERFFSHLRAFGT